METSQDREKSIAKLAELVKGIRFAMMTTADADGSLRSRPMATQEQEFDGTLWFFTKANSPKVHEVDKDHHVNLSYMHPGKDHYVSVSGQAGLVRDRAKIKELWSPMLKAWFPDGLDDPELALLRVDVDKAEYWDTHSGLVTHLVGFVKATVTGTPFRPGDHGKVDL